VVWVYLKEKYYKKKCNIICIRQGPKYSIANFDAVPPSVESRNQEERGN
jgi:hypothetical protein